MARFRSLFASLFLVLAVCSFAASPVVAQNSADRLYLAVAELQLALGHGESADGVRDTYFIRELETESAKGFSGDLSLFLRAQSALAMGDLEMPELRQVRGALDSHVELMMAASQVNLRSALSEISVELEPVSLEELADARDRTLQRLEELDDFHEDTLSIFGRHYINKYLKLNDWVERLTALDFENVEENNEWFRSLNTLRGEVRSARMRFAFKQTEYPNVYIDRAERAFNGLEQRITGYLLLKAQRAYASFQEEQERRFRLLNTNRVVVDYSDRLWFSELGRWCGLMNDRGQNADIVAATRQQFSLPNLKVTVTEAFANQRAAQVIHEVEHLDETVLGSRVQGINTIDGSVTVDFVNNPWCAELNLIFSASSYANGYTKEGPVTAYTSTNGSFLADRSLAANVGSLSVFPVNAWADMRSSFHGTDCLPIVDRIALNRFLDRQSRAEEIASERARERIFGEYEAQTNDAIEPGIEQIDVLRGRRFELLEEINRVRREYSEILSENREGRIEGDVDMIDSFMFPRLFVSTTDNELHISGLLEGDNRLAANSLPPESTVPVDLRIQIHESMISNLAAPFAQNRWFQNWQFERLVTSLSSGQIEIPENDRPQQPFAIRFEDGRPLQVVFENNEIGLVVYGREFRREGSTTGPMNIGVRLRIVDDNGTLKLVLVDKPDAEFTFLPGPDDEKLTPEDIAFRQFLQDILKEAVKGNPMDNAIELPDHLLFANYLANPELSDFLEDARLVECTSERGWLTLGWKFVQPGMNAHVAYTPAIWSELPEAPPVPAED